MFIKFVKQQPILLIVFIAFLLYGGISLYVNRYYSYYNSPDQLLYLDFAKRWAITKNLSYENSLNLQTSEKIFAPLGSIVTAQGHVLPGIFPGMLLIYSLAFLSSDIIIYLALPLSGAVCLFFLYRLLMIYLPQKESLLTIIIVASSSIFVILSASSLNNMPAIAAFMASTYFWTNGLAKSDRRSYLFAGTAAAVAIWMRYDIALFFLPLAFFTFVQGHRRQIPIGLFWAGIPAAILLGLLFLFVNHLFGHPLGNIGAFNASQLIGNPSDRYNVADPRFWFLPFSSATILLQNFIKYVILINPFLFFMALAGFLGENKRIPKELFIFLFLLFWLPIFYYCGGAFSGLDSLAIGGSYPRYMLPIYTVMAVFAALFLVHVRRWYILSLILGGYLLLNLYSAFAGNLGLQSFLTAQADSAARVTKLRQTDLPSRKSVVFYRYDDFDFFPYYTVANYDNLPLEGREKTILQLVSSLLSKGYRVYFVADDYYHSGMPETYLTYLETHGFARLAANNYVWEIKKN